MCPLVPTLNCVKLKDYLLVPVTIHTICMVLFMPTKTVGTHAATCDRVVLVYSWTDLAHFLIWWCKCVLVSGTKVSRLTSSSFLLNSFLPNSFLFASFGSFVTPYSYLGHMGVQKLVFFNTITCWWFQGLIPSSWNRPTWTPSSWTPSLLASSGV